MRIRKDQKQKTHKHNTTTQPKLKNENCGRAKILKQIHVAGILHFTEVFKYFRERRKENLCHMSRDKNDLDIKQGLGAKCSPYLKMIIYHS